MVCPGFTFCAEVTDRFGRLSVNFPLQILLSNQVVYRVTDHELAGSGKIIPEELVSMKNAYLKVGTTLMPRLHCAAAGL